MYTLNQSSAEFFQALSNPSRLLILQLLKMEELGFNDLMLKSGLLKSNLSQQLTMLERTGLIKYRKIGNHKYYSLTNNLFPQIESLVNAYFKIESA